MAELGAALLRPTAGDQLAVRGLGVRERTSVASAAASWVRDPASSDDSAGCAMPEEGGALSAGRVQTAAACAAAAAAGPTGGPRGRVGCRESLSATCRKAAGVGGEGAAVVVAVDDMASPGDLPSRLARVPTLPAAPVPAVSDAGTPASGGVSWVTANAAAAAAAAPAAAAADAAAADAAPGGGLNTVGGAAGRAVQGWVSSVTRAERAEGGRSGLPLLLLPTSCLLPLSTSGPAFEPEASWSLLLPLRSPSPLG